MAGEVVSPGKLPTERRMAGTCYYCKCEVRCLQGDAREEASGRNETDYRVRQGDHPVVREGGRPMNVTVKPLVWGRIGRSEKWRTQFMTCVFTVRLDYSDDGRMAEWQATRSVPESSLGSAHQAAVTQGPWRVSE